MLGLRPMEIALIVFALLLLFGASRLPQLGSSLGSAIKNFKRSFSEAADRADDKGDDKPDDHKLSSNESISPQDKAKQS